MTLKIWDFFSVADKNPVSNDQKLTNSITIQDVIQTSITISDSEPEHQKSPENTKKSSKPAQNVSRKSSTSSNEATSNSDDTPVFAKLKKFSIIPVNLNTVLPESELELFKDIKVTKKLKRFTKLSTQREVEVNEAIFTHDDQNQTKRRPKIKLPVKTRPLYTKGRKSSPPKQSSFDFLSESSILDSCVIFRELNSNVQDKELEMFEEFKIEAINDTEKSSVKHEREVDLSIHFGEDDLSKNSKALKSNMKGKFTSRKLYEEGELYLQKSQQPDTNHRKSGTTEIHSQYPRLTQVESSLTRIFQDSLFKIQESCANISVNDPNSFTKKQIDSQNITCETPKITKNQKPKIGPKCALEKMTKAVKNHKENSVDKFDNQKKTVNSSQSLFEALSEPSLMQKADEKTPSKKIGRKRVISPNDQDNQRDIKRRYEVSFNDSNTNRTSEVKSISSLESGSKLTKKKLKGPGAISKPESALEVEYKESEDSLGHNSSDSVSSGSEYSKIIEVDQTALENDQNSSNCDLNQAFSNCGLKSSVSGKDQTSSNENSPKTDETPAKIDQKSPKSRQKAKNTPQKSNSCHFIPKPMSKYEQISKKLSISMIVSKSKSKIRPRGRRSLILNRSLPRQQKISKFMTNIKNEPELDLSIHLGPKSGKLQHLSESLLSQKDQRIPMVMFSAFRLGLKFPVDIKLENVKEELEPVKRIMSDLKKDLKELKIYPNGLKISNCQVVLEDIMKRTSNVTESDKNQPQNVERKVKKAEKMSKSNNGVNGSDKKGDSVGIDAKETVRKPKKITETAESPKNKKNRKRRRSSAAENIENGPISAGNSPKKDSSPFKDEVIKKSSKKTKLSPKSPKQKLTIPKILKSAPNVTSNSSSVPETLKQPQKTSVTIGTLDEDSCGSSASSFGLDLLNSSGSNKKFSEPSCPETLSSTTEYTDDLNKCINDFTAVAEEFNTELDEFAAELSKKRDSMESKGSASMELEFESELIKSELLEPIPMDMECDSDVNGQEELSNRRGTVGEKKIQEISTKSANSLENLVLKQKTKSATECSQNLSILNYFSLVSLDAAEKSSLTDPSNENRQKMTQEGNNNLQNDGELTKLESTFLNSAMRTESLELISKNSLLSKYPTVPDSGAVFELQSGSKVFTVSEPNGTYPEGFRVQTVTPIAKSAEGSDVAVEDSSIQDHSIPLSATSWKSVSQESKIAEVSDLEDVLDLKEPLVEGPDANQDMDGQESESQAFASQEFGQESGSQESQIQVASAFEGSLDPKDPVEQSSSATQDSKGQKSKNQQFANHEQVAKKSTSQHPQSIYIQPKKLRTPAFFPPKNNKEADENFRKIGKNQFECRICSIVMKTKSYRWYHLYSTHRPLTIFTCDTCNFSSQNAIAISRHVCDANRKTCEICHKSYSFGTSYRLHMKLCHPQTRSNMLTCDMCGRLFYSKSKLRFHIQTHIKMTSDSFICDFDGKKFKNRERLYNHMNKHKAKKVKCEICGAMTVCHNQHMLTIHSSKTFDCDKCPKKFKSKQYLFLHTKYHEKSHNCPICKKRFAMNYEVQRHVRDFHENPRSYECSLCNQKFKTAFVLRCHKRSHFDQKRFQCQRCPLKTNQTSALKKHMDVHKKMDEKIKNMKDPMPCGVCGTVFDGSWKLKQHMRMHQQEQKFCDYCGVSFLSKSNLSRHMKVHRFVV